MYVCMYVCMYCGLRRHTAPGPVCMHVRDTARSGGATHKELNPNLEFKV
jgi:hypothetical protein